MDLGTLCFVGTSVLGMCLSFTFPKKTGQASQNDLVTYEEIITANQAIQKTSLVRSTPLEKGFLLPNGIEVALKMEHMQHTGSFKIRGMFTTFQENESRIRKNGAVTLSAGNAGMSFAFLCGRLKANATVCMPATVTTERVKKIEALGSKVDVVPNDKLLDQVKSYTDKGAALIHPFDDKFLITGHASLGLEILDSYPDVDCILVCCGGGGLVSGVAAAVKLSGRSNAKVYAVEPEMAAGMHTSFKIGRPAKYPKDFDLNTAAHGLAPPFAGDITYEHCKAFVDDVLLVSEEELIAATKWCTEQGLFVEVSGCASLAAAMAGKIPATCKNIVCVLTGRNISLREMSDVFEGKHEH